jgi:hypothetical protein
VALADWFHEPEVQELDLSNWHGGPGEIIRALAVDDVRVTQVTVLILAEDGTLLEQGPAVQAADKLWWEYVTTVAASGNPQVVVTARDLAGHFGKLEKTT